MIESNFKTVITSRHKFFDLHLRETFCYRDLIFLLVKRDFTASYKQTLLGPAWAIVQPLLTTIIFTIVFGNLAKLTTADVVGDFVVPGFLFYMAGNICFSYFSAILSISSKTFITNRRTMSRVYFPRLVAPIVTGFSRLIPFGIQMLLFLGIWVYFVIQENSDIHLSYAFLLIPLSVIQMMFLGLGLGMMISSVTTKFRDLVMLVSFGLQLWLYCTPVAYGLTLIPQKYLALYMLNPMTSVVASFRYGAFGFGFFDLKYYLLSWVASFIAFFIGLVLFSRAERSFVDTV